MKKILFLFILLMPLTGLMLSCGSSSPTSSNSGSSNTATPTPTPSVKTLVSSFSSYSGGVSVYGMCVDSSDNLYVANYNGSNSSSNLMKVTSAGAATSITQMNGLSAVAYDGTNWYGASVQNSPYSYFYNGTTVTNPISTSSGFQGMAVNSGATTIAVVVNSAVTFYSLPSFNNPQAITLAAAASGNQALAFDNSGNLYVAESNLIVKYTSGVSGSTTIAGSATSGYKDGSGSAAAFNYIRAIAVDGSGNVYASDSGNEAIRKITSGGTVTTLVGATGANVSPAFTTPSLSTDLYGIAVDGAGNVFFGDQNNSGVSKIFEYIP